MRPYLVRAYLMRDTVPDHVQYLDAAAATDQGRDYKRRLLQALDLRPGHRVVDVGCGPGTDLAAMADAVGERGSIIGVDNDPEMVQRATQRCLAYPTIEVRPGDAHLLPVRDRAADRARADRVLQHLEHPPRALAELHRVLRTGGRLGLAEPDWDTLVIDSTMDQSARSLAAYIGSRVRNRSIGHQLVRLVTNERFEVSTVDATAVVFRDPAVAEQVLGFRRNAARAVGAGALAEADASDLLGELNAGPVLASFVVWTVTAICRR
jgi:ubiquinone/menaquinone biosynthesis C-methylase UbiE